MPAEVLVLRFDDQEVEATCTVDTSGLVEIRLDKGEPLTVARSRLAPIQYLKEIIRG